MMISSFQIPGKSVAVVAHPDDEVLWLSSLLTRVDKIIFCFSDCLTAPRLGSSRRNVIAAYPLSNAVMLDIEESVSFNTADWKSPVETEHGLFIKNPEIARKYKQSHEAICKMLPTMLADVDNVFTHNPWGEYGHEDHVQVYRVIKSLQKKMGFDLWFSNYCGNRSISLMLKYISGYSSDYVTFNTNPELIKQISDLYKQHGCWTWYNDYEWFKSESFMRDRDMNSALAYGHAFPINFIKTNFDADPIIESPDFMQRVKLFFSKSAL